MADYYFLFNNYFLLFYFILLPLCLCGLYMVEQLKFFENVKKQIDSSVFQNKKKRKKRNSFQIRILMHTSDLHTNINIHNQNLLGKKNKITSTFDIQTIEELYNIAEVHNCRIARKMCLALTNLNILAKNILFKLRSSVF